MDDRTIVVAREDGGKLPSAMRLREYFESNEKSGGGVLDVLEPRSDGTALIAFRDSGDAANVETRSHQVDGIPLVVYPYYGALPETGSEYSNTATLLREKKTKSVTFTTEDANQNWIIGDADETSDTPSVTYVGEGATETSVEDNGPTETEELHMAHGKMRLLQQFTPPDITTLTKQFQKCSFQDDKIVISDGSTNFLEKVHDLKLELLNIHEETFEMTKPLVYSLLTSKRAVEELYKIERSLKCIIQIDQGFYTSREQKEEIQGETGKQESIVTLVTGDLVDQEVDVVVCSVSPELSLENGGTSRDLLRHGGQTLTAECKRNYPQGITAKEIASIPGGQLKCQQIFFIALPNFKDDQNLKIMGPMIYKCLFECSERGYSSIAFPAVGTGHRGYPAQRVAEMMFNTMTDFMSYSSPLTDVRVVIPAENNSVMEAFEANRPSFNDSHGDRDRDDESEAKHVVLHDDVRVGSLIVHVKQGKLSQDSSQALVNIVKTASSLGADSAGSDLLKECDPDITNQCRLAVNTVQKKGTALTPAPGLQAEFLLHVSLDQFKGGLKDVIKSCLKTANEHRISSLAFPSLWAETGMTLRNIAKVIVKCLEEHEKKTSCLKEVSLVVQDETDCSIFLSLLEQLIRKKARKAKARYSYRRRDARKAPGTGSSADQTIEEMYVKRVPDSDAEVTVYGRTRSTLHTAFTKVVKLYESHLVKKSMQVPNLKLLSPAKIASVKRQIDSIDICCSIAWSAGLVETEGLQEDVQRLESILQAAV